MRLAVAVVVALALMVTPARADDTIGELEQASCPGPRALEIALYAEGITGVRVTLVVVDDETLRVRATRGESILIERAIARTRDCDALAEAIALIVLARLSAMDPDADAEPPVGDGDDEPPATQPERVEATRPGNTAEAVQMAHSAPSGQSYAVSAGLVGLAVMPVGADTNTLSAELDVGITSRRGRGLRLALGRDAAARDADLERIAWTVRGEAVKVWRKRASWLRLGAGAALVVSRVTSDAVMVTTVRSHPALTTSATLGVQVGHGVSFRLDSSWAFLPVVDRYRMGGGEVARSPRASFGLGLGAQIDTDW